MEVLEKTATVEEYVELESKSQERMEFLNGEIIKKEGETLAHEFIYINIVKALSNCLAEKGCILISGNVKMFTPDCNNAFLYPDFHIYCEGTNEEKEPFGMYALSEPSFIIEVLSKSTRNFDKGDKFECYRKMKSLKKYVLIESQLDIYEPAVLVRTLEGENKFTEQKLGIEDAFEVLGCKLKVAEVYKSLVK